MEDRPVIVRNNLQEGLDIYAEMYTTEAYTSWVVWNLLWIKQESKFLGVNYARNNELPFH